MDGFTPHSLAQSGRSGTGKIQPCLDGRGKDGQSPGSMKTSGCRLARFAGACGVAAAVTCGAIVLRAAGQTAGNGTARAASAATAPIDINANVALCNTGDGKACNFVGAVYATGLQGIKLDLPQAFTF